MTILIIEDTEYKAKSIQALLRDCEPNADVAVAKSFQTGKRALTELKPDLILLDMTMQTSERSDGQTEGRNRMFGGREILAEMDFCGLIAPVIVITQFDHFGEAPNVINVDTLFSQLKLRFPHLFIGGVYYNNLSSEWQGSLLRLIKSITSKSQ